MADGTDKTKDDSSEKLISAAEQTAEEMKSAMWTMMDASTRMMQSFLDMRLSYLKVMRATLDDPQTTFKMMVDNANDVSEQLKKQAEDIKKKQRQSD